SSEFLPHLRPGTGLPGQPGGRDALAASPGCHGRASLHAPNHPPGGRAFSDRVRLHAAAAGSLAITPWTREPLTLALASMAGGIGIGLVQPLSMLGVAETVDEGERGRAMGLRLTGNRAAQFTSPVLFGLVAEVAGLETAFVVGGLLLMAATASLFLWRDTFARLDRRRSARRP